ncbi:hypothetical protein ACFC09_37905 [Streptomyces sp. NPDC056161]|uniref:hypothetical protein n=1 Tax=Streptomyces sp. NPDC056161 TaxID=3345732 RepID=UPI0035D5DFEB
MPVPRLIAAVYVRHPQTREEMVLLPGQRPDPQIAALITNPDAWDVAPGAEGPEAAEAEEPVPVTPMPDAGQSPDTAEAADKGAAKRTTQRRARSAAE